MEFDLSHELSSLRRVADTLHAKALSTRSKAADKVDLSDFRDRESCLGQLRNLYTELNGLLEAVGRYGREVQEMHTSELVSLKSYLGQGKQAPERTSRACQPAAGNPAPARGGAPPPDPAPRPERALVSIAEGVSLEALVVAGDTERKILEAIRTPELHYVPKWNHFAIRVGTILLHGNVGNVYGGRTKKPQRVRDCKRRVCSRAGCGYYHDPAQHPGSQDVRNYMADAFLYCPAAGEAHVRYGGRRIGSRDALGLDLELVSESDVRRTLDQTAHDMLCALVAAQARHTKK